MGKPESDKVTILTKKKKKADKEKRSSGRKEKLEGRIRTSSRGESENSEDVTTSSFGDGSEQEGAGEITNNSTTTPNSSLPSTPDKYSPANSASALPASLAQLKQSDSKGKKASIRSIRKIGVIYKEGKPSRFRKYSAVLKDGKLSLRAMDSGTTGKKSNTSVMMDLLLAQPIDLKEVQEVTCSEPSNTKLFTVDIVTESRKDLIGFETREELDDWVDKINKAVQALRGKKKKEIAHIDV